MKRPKIRYVVSICIVLIFALTLTLIPAFTYKPSFEDIIASCACKNAAKSYLIALSSRYISPEKGKLSAFSIAPIIEPESTPSCCGWDYCCPNSNGHCPAGYQPKSATCFYDKQCPYNAAKGPCKLYCKATALICRSCAFNPHPGKLLACIIGYSLCRQCVLSHCPHFSCTICRKCVEPCP